MDFWNRQCEINFFRTALKNFASPEQLFYAIDDRHYAYIPKDKAAQGQTLQSRNSLIGQYTERWCAEFLQPIAQSLGLFAVNAVICPELGLGKATNADIALCTTNEINQPSHNIKLVIEVKMSIVNNYIYRRKTGKVEYIGDYKTHRGIPSILRSDSMLKAIGKSINIRVSGIESTHIPIVVLGNSPISTNYLKKVDFLKLAGVLQGFISLYPTPSTNYIKQSADNGFQTFDSYPSLKSYVTQLTTSNMSYFSSMLPKSALGKIIAKAAQQKTNTARAETFLQLINRQS